MATLPLLTTIPEGPIKPVLPPWTLKAEAFIIPFHLSESDASAVPADILYSSLERPTYGNKTECGKFVGGLGSLHIVRYSASPVGPYDELVVCPGYYTWTEETRDYHDGSVRKEVKKNLRITRIYVSQKHTCWNGRKNWNIPKHLASFKWIDNLDGSLTVQVFPHDLHPKTDPSDSKPSTSAFFTATVKKVPLVPAFPMNTVVVGMLGIDISFVQPPLPEGKGSRGELVGTDAWTKILAVEKSWRTHIAWFDCKQPEKKEDEEEETEEENVGRRAENFLPGIKRWNLGVYMEDATILFGDGEHWTNKIA